VGGKCIQEFDDELEKYQLEDPDVEGRILKNRIGGH